MDGWMGGWIDARWMNNEHMGTGCVDGGMNEGMHSEHMSNGWVD